MEPQTFSFLFYKQEVPMEPISCFMKSIDSFRSRLFIEQHKSSY
jgi:hypothetical protein